MTDLTRLSLLETREALASGKTRAVELAEAFLERRKRFRHLNCFVYENENLLAEAQAADERRRQGDEAPLLGIPVAHKDLFCTQGIPTTACSRVLSSFTPPYESTVTAKFKQAGAVMLGKLNCDEFAMGSATVHSCFGPSLNPWRAPDSPEVPRVAGGSSGGSAAAVAGRLALAATGTDTGGSIRQPAAFTGCVGLKPTYGRCSRWGIVAFASSLDQAGPLARTVADAAFLLGVMAGHDPKDSTSAPRSTENFGRWLGESVAGKRVGIPEDYLLEDLPPDTRRVLAQAQKALEDAGAQIVSVRLPHTRVALATYYIIAPAEASSNLARYDGLRFGTRVEAPSLEATYRQSRQFGPEVKRRLMIGTYVLSAGYYEAYYERAMRVRRLVRDDFDQAWRQCDVLLTPTTPSDAFPLDEIPEDPVTMYQQDVFTVPASLAGVPALSLPGGLSDRGLPLGVQLMAPPFQEARLCQVAHALERALAFSAQPPE